MTRHRFTTLLARAAIVPLTALALIGTGSAVTSAGAATKTGTVVVKKTDLGKVLVSAKGRTLYMFGKDSGDTSACTGACATNWPPLRVTGTPTVGKGAKAALIGTITRTDGNAQVTYNGHPVYLFVGDKKAGDTNGEGLNAFGGTWDALTSSGRVVTANSSSSSGSSSGGLGY